MAEAETVVQAAALWLWHAPALFDLALEHEGWHIAQHLSFLVSALFFWSVMFYRRSSPGVAAGCLFVTSLIGGALGAFMAVSQSPWYAPYAEMGLTPMGLTPPREPAVGGADHVDPGRHGARAVRAGVRRLDAEGKAAGGRRCASVAPLPGPP